MARKEFTYRGIGSAQLSQMSVQEFARLVPSRERRTLLRGLTNDEKSLLRKLAKRESVKTHAREMIVIPQMVGKKINVHNGKEYTALEITEEMLGKRLGQFVMTRKIAKHSSPGVMGAKKTAEGSVKVE